MSAPFGMYGGYKYESTESRALGSITTESYDYRDQAQFMSKMAGDVSYMASYMRKMQKGIDDANQNFVQQIQSLLNDFLALLGGSGDTGFDFGDLKYIIQAFGSLFGLQPGLPLPVNLFGAAWHFFSNYIMPAGNFTELINQIIDSAIATALDIFGEVPIVGQAVQQLAQILSSLRDLIVPVFESLGSVLDIFNIRLGDIPSLEGFFTPLEPIFTVLKNAFNGLTGTFDNIIGSIPANVITGVINSINIPDIDAGKIIGILSSLNLPDIDAGKIIGAFPLSMITGLVDALSDIDLDLSGIFSDLADLFNFKIDTDFDIDKLFDWFAQAFAKFNVSNITEWLNDLFGTKGLAATAFSNAQTALTDAQLALTDVLNKLGISDFNTFLTNVFGTTTITGATKIAQDKINGLVADLGSAVSNANTALTNANQALANFTAALTKFGVGSVSAWLNDLFGTKGTANAAQSTVSNILQAGLGNIATNSGFEDTTQYLWDATYVTSPVRTGIRAARLAGNNGVYKYLPLSTDATSAVRITSGPNRVYYMECWCRGADSNTWTGNGAVRFFVTGYGVPGYVAADIKDFKGSDIGTGQWVKLSATLTVPNDSRITKILPYIVTYSAPTTESYYFDDVIVRDVTEANVAETLANAVQATANTALTDAQKAISDAAAIVLKLFGGAAMGSNILESLIPALTIGKIPQLDQSKITNLVNDLGAKLAAGVFNTFLTNVFGTTNVTNATKIAQDKITGLVSGLGTAASNASTALTNANQALANFAAALTKFGVPSVTDWLNDLFGTKGNANTALTNAATANSAAAAAQAAFDQKLQGGENLCTNPSFENTGGYLGYWGATYSTAFARHGSRSVLHTANGTDKYITLSSTNSAELRFAGRPLQKFYMEA
ncbi:MAG: hypothetical protein WAO31_06770, partial [Rhodoluna sp.]